MEKESTNLGRRVVGNLLCFRVAATDEPMRPQIKNKIWVFIVRKRSSIGTKLSLVNARLLWI